MGLCLGDTLLIIDLVIVLVRVFRIDALAEIDGLSVRVIADESDRLTVPVIVLLALDEPVIVGVDVVV